jgi:hypothetical protein
MKTCKELNISLCIICSERIGGICWVIQIVRDINRLQKNEDSVKKFILDEVNAFGGDYNYYHLIFTVNKYFPEYIDILNKVIILK